MLAPAAHHGCHLGEEAAGGTPVWLLGSSRPRDDRHHLDWRAAHRLGDARRVHRAFAAGAALDQAFDGILTLASFTSTVYWGSTI